MAPKPLPAMAQSTFSPLSHRGLQSEAGRLPAEMAILVPTQPGLCRRGAGAVRREIPTAAGQGRAEEPEQPQLIPPSAPGALHTDELPVAH